MFLYYPTYFLPFSCSCSTSTLSSPCFMFTFSALVFAVTSWTTSTRRSSSTSSSTSSSSRSSSQSAGTSYSKTFSDSSSTAVLNETEGEEWSSGRKKVVARCFDNQGMMDIQHVAVLYASPSRFSLLWYWSYYYSVISVSDNIITNFICQ